MPPLPVVVFLCGLPLLFGVFHAFDRLVIFERTQHPADWKADGEPSPSFFRGGLEWRYAMRSNFASHRCVWRWLFVTPKWSREDANASRHLRRLRVLTAAHGNMLAVIDAASGDLVRLTAIGSPAISALGYALHPLPDLLRTPEAFRPDLYAFCFKIAAENWDELSAPTRDSLCALVGRERARVVRSLLNSRG